MMPRTTTRFACTALLGLTLATGCGDDGPATGDSQNLTEREDVAFDVKGWVVAGSQQGWQDACNAWADKLKAVAPADAVRSYECGDRKTSSSGLVLHSSEPVAHLVVSLPRGTTPLSFEPVAIVGSGGTIGSVAPECNAEIDRLAALYGKRLLAASCGVNTKVPGSGLVRYTAPLTAWIAPPSGAAVEVSGYILGSSQLESWTKACNEYVVGVGALSGVDNLAGYSCGEPALPSSGAQQWFSTAKATVRVRLAAGTEPEKLDLGLVTGQGSSVAGWQIACNAVLGKAREEHGDRFLAAYCDTPKATTSGAVQYQSQAYAWLGDRARPEDGSGGGGGAGGDSGNGGAGGGAPTDPPCADATPATECMTRCLAMMDTCDAGPAQSTCDYICEAAPTECELSCGEKTACEQIGDWFDVCHLGE